MFRTATPLINRAKRRHSVALSELGTSFLNAAQRAVYRKVQGSNPWSGAISQLSNRRTSSPDRLASAKARTLALEEAVTFAGSRYTSKTGFAPIPCAHGTSFGRRLTTD